MSVHASVTQSLAQNLIQQIEEVILAAEQAGAPLEVDPQRKALFELFVMADAAGGLEDGADPDLSSDHIARVLSERWNLAKQVGPNNLAHPRVRILWSFMRMWMEWSYAWERWEEFHTPTKPLNGDPEID